MQLSNQYNSNHNYAGNFGKVFNSQDLSITHNYEHINSSLTEYNNTLSFYSTDNIVEDNKKIFIYKNSNNTNNINKFDNNKLIITHAISEIITDNTIFPSLNTNTHNLKDGTLYNGPNIQKKSDNEDKTKVVKNQFTSTKRKNIRNSHNYNKRKHPNKCFYYCCFCCLFLLKSYTHG